MKDNITRIYRISMFKNSGSCIKICEGRGKLSNDFIQLKTKKAAK